MQLHKDLEKELPALIIQLPKASQSEGIKRWRNKKDPLFHPVSPVDGHTLQERLNLPPGKLIGLLMNYLELEHAFGRLNNRKEAIRSARYWVEQNQNLM